MDYAYYGVTTDQTIAVGSGIASFGIITVLFILALVVFYCFCLIKIYKKAGRKWWEAIVPVYNYYVLTQIADLEILYFILYFVPIVNIYALFKTYISLANKFGKSKGFGVCLILFAPICLPILAFDKSIYNGNTGVQPTNQEFLNQQPIYAVPTPQDAAKETFVNGVAQPEVIEPTPASKVCSACGTQVSSDAQVCPNCGSTI